MQKLILMSIIIATFAIPVIVDRRRAGQAQFGTLLAGVFLFVAFYVLALIIIYPRLF